MPAVSPDHADYARPGFAGQFKRFHDIGADIFFSVASPYREDKYGVVTAQTRPNEPLRED
jgi:hypothetical protein